MPAGPPAISKTHVLLIPSYNSGTLLRETVKQALNHHQPVWVIIDGSTDGSDSDLESIPAPASGLRVFRLPKNGGKGAALLHGATKAFAAGFTHLLTMDGDAQHPAEYLPHYIEESRKHPGAMILGKPVFDDSAPLIRIYGRRLSNFWTILFTLGGGMKDCLFGMRAYPLPAFLRTLESTRWARRYDFDGEICVRLSWAGLPARNVDTPVRYLPAEKGGISHFHYVRDNIRLVWMYARLLPETLLRLPWLLARRLARALSDADPGDTTPPQPAPSSTSKALSRSFVKPLYRHYSRGKLHTDPLYEGIHQVLMENELPLLDVGCGLGLLAGYLRARGWFMPITGVDLDEDKILAARAASAQRGENGVEFIAGDARNSVPNFCGNVALLDFLQFLHLSEQEALLRDLARRVAPGGIFVIRACLDDGTWRYLLTIAADWFALGTRWMPSAPVHYPLEAGMRNLLAREGLTGLAEPLWGLTPFNNQLLVFRRPEANGTARE